MSPACDTTSLGPGELGYAIGPATLVGATLCVSRTPQSKSDLGMGRIVAVPLSAAQLAQLTDALGPGRRLCDSAVVDAYLVGKTGTDKVTESEIATCGSADLVACSTPPCPEPPVWRPPARAARLLLRLARRAG